MKQINEMSVFELSRWYALMEAVNLISTECEKRGKNFDKLKISPLDIEHYIEKTCDIFARKIQEEQAKKAKMHINIHTSDHRQSQHILLEA